MLRLAREREDDAELVELAGMVGAKKLLPERKAGEGLRFRLWGRMGASGMTCLRLARIRGEALGRVTKLSCRWWPGCEALSVLPRVKFWCIWTLKGKEVAIAAALSKDEELRRAYESGDVYTAIARMAGAITAHTSEEEARRVRRTYKVLTLGRNTGCHFAPSGRNQVSRMRRQTGRSNFF